jgi:GTP-binding protein Era
MPKSGSVALVGRPNAGKSTLLNRLLGEKVAIVSDKPQTTRHRIVGILSAAQGQIVFQDTPGIHRPLHRLNRQMVRQATESIAEADVVCLIVDAAEPHGNGDQFLLELARGARTPKVAVLNKIDQVAKAKLLPRMALYAEGNHFEAIVPISALDGDGCERLLAELWRLLPEGEPRYDADLLTPHSERFLVGERIREKILELTRNELPFTTAVLVDGWEDQGPDRVLRISASILVERDSHKSILVGRRGAMIKKIGTTARLDVEEFLDRRVFLDLHVRHEPDWREDQRMLTELDRHLHAPLDAEASRGADGDEDPGHGEDPST